VYYYKGKWCDVHAVVAWGFMEVLQDKVTYPGGDAERPAQIDRRARRKNQKAEPNNA